jgi:hypothetical protein
MKELRSGAMFSARFLEQKTGELGQQVLMNKVN